jgi:hypothetical protein
LDVWPCSTLNLSVPVKLVIGSLSRQDGQLIRMWAIGNNTASFRLLDPEISYDSLT